MTRAQDAAMSKDEFIARYIAAFLGSYAAVKYDDMCQRHWPDYVWQPTEDAKELAEEAWKQLEMER